LNGASVGGWTDYATLIEEAGADALELNVYYVPANLDMPGNEVEDLYVEILTAVRHANLTALLAYDPPPYDGELTYFRTAASERALPRDGALDFWRARALRGLTLHRVAGSHGTILLSPYVSDVAGLLAAAVRGTAPLRLA